ncbi:hypothetical protein [Labrys wisconsinensis]|uniref:Uncharacterized protein n=1 Tax=Labrys wisconsinensis TaxID=425677 RepID=A0ABU0J1K5_9HYPH|nr:hypothetical protein [Labrys wisconsinensis]MDQ0467117.1 hypothetical protein [Labrys wisconsinensis]
MHFVTRSESERFFERMGIDDRGPMPGSRSDARLKIFDVYYQSRLAVADKVSRVLASRQGDFSTCHLWVHGLPFGDRSLDETPPPDWARYRRWREATGETRSLYEAPGHVFQEGEQEVLARVIEFAILLGWDALIAAVPHKGVLDLSHDDRITIYARSRPSGLIVGLERLGLTARKRALR